jgi:hypothetical protein
VLRYGIRAFDTSAYYGPSEIVLGGVLKALKDEFPRESYKLVWPALMLELQTADDLAIGNQVRAIRLHSCGFRLLPEHDPKERAEEPGALGYELPGCRVFA